MRQVSITPLALMDEVPFKDDFKHARISIPMGSLFSMIMLLDAETVKIDDFGRDFYTFGRNMVSAFNTLTENYYYSVDSMPKGKDTPFYTKSEILENALSLTPTSGISDLMRKEFGSKPNSHDVKWPDRNGFGYDTCAFKRKLDLAKEFVHSKLNLFGIAEAFYYAPGGNRSNKYDDLFKEYFVLPDGVIADREYSWTDIVTMYQNEEITDVLRKARRERKIIKFNMPIKVKFVQGDPKENMQIAPIIFSDNQVSPVTLKELPIFYRDAEEFLRREMNSKATMEDPDWLVKEKDIPRMLYAETKPNDLIHTGFDVHVEGYKVIDETDRMVFVARNL